MTQVASTSNEAVAQLQQLLVGFSSKDNAIREQAEQAFEQVWVPQPNALVPGLCAVITTDAEATSRALAAVVLRRAIGKLAAPSAATRAAVRVWNVLDATIQQQCCGLLLKAWQQESSKEVRNRISDAIAEVARLISTHEEWPQLLAMLWTVDASKDVEFVSSALRILAAVPECVNNQQSSTVASYLGQFFGHASVEVRLAAIKALHAIVLNSSDDRKLAYAPLLNQLPEFFKALVEAGDPAEEALIESINAIVEMTDECPKLFRSLAPRLTPILLAMIDAEIDEEVRTAALELMTTLVEAMPATFRKQKDLCNAVVTLLLKTISDNLDEGEEWYKATPDDENEEEALSLAGEQALDRVAIALTGKVLLPALMENIPGMLHSGDWKHRYAALRSIANMAEGCSDVLADRLDELLSLVWPAFTDVHPRVQYAACHALGQLCTDFAGPLQEHFAEQCLSSLVGVLGTASQPRVQAHAAAALINFAEGVDSAIIEPVLDGLLNRLAALLGTSIVYLQEQVIATMAAFSAAAGAAFTKFLPQIMPLLMNCLTSNLDRAYRMLQCRALEAATMVAVAVGKEAFSPYAQPLLDVMVGLQRAELESDDMIADYLSPSWVRMCQVLGTDFVQFVPLVLPRLLAEAAAEPDVAVVEAGEEDQYDPEEWDFATVRGRRLGINTATLETKSCAIENLGIYIGVLQGAFAPYAEQTFATVLPLIHFNLHEGVQSAAADALASLIKTFSQTSPPPVAVIKNVAGQSLDAMLKELSGKQTVDAEIIVSLLDAMADIANVSSSAAGAGYEGGDRTVYLPDGFLQGAFREINALLTILQHGHQSRSGSRQHVDEDDEDEERNREDDEETIMYGIVRLAAALFRAYREHSLAPAETLLQFCLRSIAAGKQLALFKHASLCVLDDLVHWLGAHTAPIQQYIAQCFAAGVSGDDADNRQAAIFGIGMCSEHAPALYEGLCLESLPLLLKAIAHPDSKAPSVVTVTDNAMSAVARICKAYPAKIGLATVLPTWLGGLPVTHDEDEAPIVYGWLLELLSSGAVHIDGEQGARILHALVEALVRECLAEPVKSQVKGAAATLRQSLPPQSVQAALSSYSPEQLAKLN